MNILKVQRKPEFCKYTGLHLPEQIHSYLALYTSAKGITKSEVIRHAIENWIKQVQTEVSNSELIEEVTKMIKILWKLEKSSNIHSDLSSYKKRLAIEMKSKGIGEKHIDTILKEL